MIKSSCPIQQKIDKLIQKSKGIKVELDNTPYEDDKKFKYLLKTLLEVHREMDQTRKDVTN
ncbi:hypothetical protein F7731_14920 [Cytobacillus depressus]|uniref:Uncharacterized protein n=1 Tax=Cytobacillus depressus TaxID=1602942 RepID=A0A6L3V3D0_9BACI|nr:hypothetical protein [Cytobacillus depressus]KAB2334498.1 hypothetical protein F7731_14920 [Cytobacillus depressus]